MKDNDFLEIMNKHFGVHEDEEYIEFETWTDGGVNMFVTVHKKTDKSYFEQFEEYVKNFDIDEEIDIHRQDKLYKSHFTITRSVADFGDYKKWLENIVTEMEELDD
jgi:hypothetical protein